MIIHCVLIGSCGSAAPESTCEILSFCFSLGATDPSLSATFDFGSVSFLDKNISDRTLHLV